MNDQSITYDHAGAKVTKSFHQWPVITKNSIEQNLDAVPSLNFDTWLLNFLH